MIIINYNIIQHCIIPNISQIVGEHPVSVIVNKIDLLPVFVILYQEKISYIRLERWIRGILKDFNIQV